MPLEFIEISKLELLERNPRKITQEQFSKLKKSLKQDPKFFELRPCLVNRVQNKYMTVYAGNQRVRAAKDLGWTKVPCIIDDELDAETMRFRVVADNAHFGENDWDVLSSDYSIEELFNAGYTES